MCIGYFVDFDPIRIYLVLVEEDLHNDVLVEVYHPPWHEPSSHEAINNTLGQCVAGTGAEISFRRNEILLLFCF